MHVRFKGKRSSEYFAVHEVYYGRRGRVVSWTVDPCDLVGETVQEIRRDLPAIQRALRRPVLVVDDRGGGRLMTSRPRMSRVKL